MDIRRLNSAFTDIKSIDDKKIKDQLKNVASNLGIKDVKDLHHNQLIKEITNKIFTETNQIAQTQLEKVRGEYVSDQEETGRIVQLVNDCNQSLQKLSEKTSTSILGKTGNVNKLKKSIENKIQGLKPFDKLKEISHHTTDSYLVERYNLYVLNTKDYQPPKDTWLDSGADIHDVLRDNKGYLTAYQSKEATSKEKKPLIQITKELEKAEKYTDGISALNNKQIREADKQKTQVNLRNEVIQDIKNLKEGESVLIPSGFMGESVGHSVMLVAEKQPETNKYLFTVINTGDGLKHHEEKNKKYYYDYKIGDLALESLTDTQFIDGLINLKKNDSNHTIDQMYQHIQNHLKGTQVNKKNAGKYGGLQAHQAQKRESNCTQKSVMGFIKNRIIQLTGDKKLHHKIKVKVQGALTDKMKAVINPEEGIKKQKQEMKLSKGLAPPKHAGQGERVKKTDVDNMLAVGEKVATKRAEKVSGKASPQVEQSPSPKSPTSPTPTPQTAPKSWAQRFFSAFLPSFMLRWFGWA